MLAVSPFCANVAFGADMFSGTWILNTSKTTVDNFKLPGDPSYVAYLEPAIADFLSGQPIRQTETASFGCAIKSIYYILPRPL